ncbi:hypothetical protein F8S13_19910 [Chloroflexia bacterium SDU3-3]|nr:hypothetical protein F8S13_19910 [Chloroflexia bacterium SDU3-3]
MADDGLICGSPMPGDGSYYGHAEKRYWFMFPMADAVSTASFIEHKAQVGASIRSAAGYVNRLIDQIKRRFDIPTTRIFLCGFQHGSCLALSVAMMRNDDPLGSIFLVEPYYLESLHAADEKIEGRTTVICVENAFMRARTHQFLGIAMDEQLKAFGIRTERILTDSGEEHLTDEIIASIGAYIGARLGGQS